MRIAVGVCGIGYGHSSRQLQIVRRLVQKGHEVRIITFGNGSDYFARTEFWDRVRDVFVPWVETDSGGVRWADTVRLNLREGPAGLLRNRMAMKALRDEGFRPDVCVSDYDPVTARLAARTGVPLVTVDHQSTYLGYRLPALGGLSSQEERARLALFFPDAAKRLAISFFEVDSPPDEKYRVQLMPPVVRRDVVELSKASRTVNESLVLVYLSRYPKKGSFVDVAALTRIFEKFPDRRFKVYSHDVREQSEVASNVEVSPTLNADFVADLGKASALVCTAGFTLLSEAMLLGVPVLAIPLATYDQHLCAQIIADFRVGERVASENDVSVEALESFLDGLDGYRRAIAGSDRLLHAGDEDVVERICEEVVTA